jgi:hypothetical protein
MNYYEKLGKMYHQLLLNEDKYNTTPRTKGKSMKHSFKQVSLKIKIEKLMFQELRKEKPDAIGVCNVRSAWVNYYPNQN